MAPPKRTFVGHLHPPFVRRHTLRPSATFGLGIAALTCFGVLLATGVTLFLYYVPSGEDAYERILHITTTLRYGRLVRNLHSLAANALVVLSVLHLGRVFFTGSYKGRWTNWCYGLALFLLVLASNYTGYLLPWDQTAYWALQVGSRLMNHFPVAGPGIRSLLFGSEDIGPDTLARAFALHAGALPLAWLVLTSLHLWRIRRDGGLSAPDPEEERVPAKPWLHRAEFSVALLTLSALLLLALLVPAPLAERADPLHPPNPAKAPWYFVGVQEMVSHSTLIGGVVVPAFFALFLALVPVLDRSRSPGGVWFHRDRLGWNLALALALASQAAFIAIGHFLRGENWSFHLPFSP